MKTLFRWLIIVGSALFTALVFFSEQLLSPEYDVLVKSITFSFFVLVFIGIFFLLSKLIGSMSKTFGLRHHSIESDQRAESAINGNNSGLEKVISDKKEVKKGVVVSLVISLISPLVTLFGIPLLIQVFNFFPYDLVISHYVIFFYSLFIIVFIFFNTIFLLVSGNKSSKRGM